jgi:hypothetical protein
MMRMSRMVGIVIRKPYTTTLQRYVSHIWAARKVCRHELQTRTS